MGLLLFASLSFPRIVSLINPEKKYSTIPDRIDQIITVTKVFPNQVKKSEQPVLPKAIQQNLSSLKTTTYKPNSKIALARYCKKIENTTAIMIVLMGSAILAPILLHHKEQELLQSLITRTLL
jgi:protein TonB